MWPSNTASGEKFVRLDIMWLLSNCSFKTSISGGSNLIDQTLKKIWSSFLWPSNTASGEKFVRLDIMWLLSNCSFKTSISGGSNLIDQTLFKVEDDSTCFQSVLDSSLRYLLNEGVEYILYRAREFLTSKQSCTKKINKTLDYL